MTFRIYRRHLTHVRVAGATYLVTWCVQRGRDGLSASERDTVVSALRYFDGTRYTLRAFVVMDDHVHVVVTPFEGHELEQVIHSWKGFSAREINRSRGHSGSFWEREYCDRVIANERDLSTTITYVLQNPRRRWPDARDYRWAEPRPPRTGLQAGPSHT